MTLAELIEKVKLPNQTKSDLEELRDSMAHLYSLYQLETARIKKAKALFWAKMKPTTYEGKRITNTEVDNLWDCSEQGQREIQLKYESIALKELLSSIKHKLYSVY